MISRKESNQLVPKAGLGLIDNVLNKFSNRSISNKEVSEEFEKINEYLLETPIYDKTTGKWYERNDDGTRGDEIQVGGRTLDYANAVVHYFAGKQTDTTFTCSKNGDLFYSLEAPKLISINGKDIFKVCLWFRWCWWYINYRSHANFSW